MNAVNRILAGLLALQIVLLFVVGNEAEPTMRPPTALFAQFAGEDVTRIQLFAAAETKADAVPNIDLVKRRGAWVVASHYDYPADTAAVTRLLSKLTTLRSRGPVTTSASRHKQLKVADDTFEGKIVLSEEPDGKEATRTLLLGTSPKFKNTHVRIAGENEIHAVSQLDVSDVATDFKEWIREVYAENPVDSIAAVHIENPLGSFSLQRDDKDQWKVSSPDQPSQVETDPQAASDLIRKIEKFEVAELVGTKGGHEFGFDKPQATVKVTFKERPSSEGKGSEHAESSSVASIYQIGGKKGDDAYYFRSLERPHVIAVRASAVADLLEATAAKLKKTETKPQAPDSKSQPARGGQQ